MRELAYLNAGIKITLTDLRVKDEENNAKMEVFYSEEGLKEFVRYIDSSREHLVNDVIYINTEKQGTPVEVAIMYNTSYNEKYPLLRKQYQYHRRWYAPYGFPPRTDPYAEEICRRQQDAGKS